MGKIADYQINQLMDLDHQERYFRQKNSLTIEMEDHIIIRERSKWQTQGNKQILIKDLKDNHIRNIIRMLSKHDSESKWVKTLQLEQKYRKR